MITYEDARAGAELVRSEYEAGDSTSTINYQLSVRYPLANGFERNRMIFRGVQLFDNQLVIRAGSPPAVVTAPFPTPPSTGPSTHPNSIRIVATILVDHPILGLMRSQIAADGVSGQAYAIWAAQVAMYVAFKQLLYPTATVTVEDPARYVY